MSQESINQSINASINQSTNQPIRCLTKNSTSSFLPPPSSLLHPPSSILPPPHPFHLSTSSPSLPKITHKQWRKLGNGSCGKVGGGGSTHLHSHVLHHFSAQAVFRRSGRMQRHDGEGQDDKEFHPSPEMHPPSDVALQQQATGPNPCLLERSASLSSPLPPSCTPRHRLHRQGFSFFSQGLLQGALVAQDCPEWRLL